LALVGQRAGPTVAEKTVVSDEFDVVPSMTRFDAIDANGVAVRCVAGATAVKIMHRERCVGRDLVKTLTTIYGLLNRVLIIKDLVPYWIIKNH
jgi:hypothetical protein